MDNLSWKEDQHLHLIAGSDREREERGSSLCFFLHVRLQPECKFSRHQTVSVQIKAIFTWHVMNPKTKIKPKKPCKMWLYVKDDSTHTHTHFYLVHFIMGSFLFYIFMYFISECTDMAGISSVTELSLRLYGSSSSIRAVRWLWRG